VKIQKAFFLAVVCANCMVAVPNPSLRLPSGHQVSEQGDMQPLLSRLQAAVDEAISSDRGKKLAGELKTLRVEEPKSWFVKVFGPSSGPNQAYVYSKSFEDREKGIVKFFVALAQRGGKVTLLDPLENDAPMTEYRQRFDDAIRQTLVPPAKLYHLYYIVGSPSKESPNSFSFGYLVFVEGHWNLLSAEVIRAMPGMPPMRIRQGGDIVDRSALTKVQPEYPAEAKDAHVSGTVRLRAVIGTDGAVKTLELISGDPALAKAALDAVKQWRYRPTTINGEPVEIDTTIDVIFTLK
jgi:TonB family protein